MIRLEKIKEFKSIRSYFRIIYSEQYGMILTVPSGLGPGGFNVHSFDTGKLVFRHRDNEMAPHPGRVFRIGRWAFLRFRNMGSPSLFFWKVFDFETLTVSEAFRTCGEGCSEVIGRVGSRVLFSADLGLDPKTRQVRSGIVYALDLADGVLSPCADVTGLDVWIKGVGPTRWFGVNADKTVAFAVDEKGLPTLRRMEEFNSGRMVMCGSTRYLLASQGKPGQKAEFLLFDSEMHLINRVPLRDACQEGWVSAVELPHQANPGILVYRHTNARCKMRFYDANMRSILWQTSYSKMERNCGISGPMLLDGYLVCQGKSKADVINTNTGEWVEIGTSDIPFFMPSVGFGFYDCPSVAPLVCDGLPKHLFWERDLKSPLSLGVVVESSTAGVELPPLDQPPQRKRKKPAPGIPEIPERPGVHILCTKDVELSAQMKAFGEWLPFFRKVGVNLYGYIYDPSGEGDFSDAELKEMGNTLAEIECIRLAATGDWHDPAALAADLRRCEALVPDKPRNSRSRKRILRELEHLIGLCDNAAAAGLKVQLLAPPADCEDEDNWFDKGEEDDDEDE